VQGVTNITDESEDALLIDSLLEGDKVAFEILLKRHSLYFYKVAYRIALAKEDAEDIVQEAFLKLLDGRARWSPGKNAKFKSWFYRIILNQALDFERKNKLIRKNNDILSVSKIELQDKVSEREEGNQEILNALQKLTYKQRIAIELTYYSDLNQQDGSKILGLSIKAYESLLSRAKDKLRKELADYER
jgi:RNA polymerase sigma-70 factor (ECF subfamily)